MTDNPNVILLIKQGGIWCAQYSGPHAPIIRRLFHSDTLPTTCTDSVPAEQVRAMIQRLNPDAVVRVG